MTLVTKRRILPGWTRNLYLLKIGFAEFNASFFFVIVLTLV